MLPNGFQSTNIKKDSFLSLLLLLCHDLYVCCHSPDEPMVRLQHQVSASLKQALEKLKLSENTAEKKGENRTLSSPLLSPLSSSP